MKTITKKINAMGEFPHKNHLIEFILHVLNDFDVRLIALFGSVCKGNWTETSDVDVFIVGTDFPKRMLDRWDALNEYMIPVDFKAYLVEEFKEMLQDWDLFVLEVLECDKILHDPDDLGKNAKNEFERLKQEGKIRQCSPRCWIVP